MLGAKALLMIEDAIKVMANCPTTPTAAQASNAYDAVAIIAVITDIAIP